MNQENNFNMHALKIEVATHGNCYHLCMAAPAPELAKLVNRMYNHGVVSNVDEYFTEGDSTAVLVANRRKFHRMERRENLKYTFVPELRTLSRPIVDFFGLPTKKKSTISQDS